MERIDLGGVSLAELGSESQELWWCRGGFPLSFLAASRSDSLAWRRNFLQTLLGRDLPSWGVRVPAQTLQRCWGILAHYHGPIWNAAAPAPALGVNRSTTRHDLELLSDAFMIRQLQPWHAHLSKRQVKAPKIYLRDRGLLHQLLGIDSEKARFSHPGAEPPGKASPSSRCLRTSRIDAAYCWSTHQGAGIDLMLE